MLYEKVEFLSNGAMVRSTFNDGWPVKLSAKPRAADVAYVSDTMPRDLPGFSGFTAFPARHTSFYTNLVNMVLVLERMHAGVDVIANAVKIRIKENLANIARANQ